MSAGIGVNSFGGDSSKQRRRIPNPRQVRIHVTRSRFEQEALGFSDFDVYSRSSSGNEGVIRERADGQRQGHKHAKKDEQIGRPYHFMTPNAASASGNAIA
jgi:hypothetical protein